jgi:hypothetical protein
VAAPKVCADFAKANEKFVILGGAMGKTELNPDGVKALASKSSELTQEIRENRPLAANAVFNEFATNKVQASIYAARSGLFGNKNKDTSTILVTDGTNSVAVCHVQETPLAFPPGLWRPLRNNSELKGGASRWDRPIEAEVLHQIFLIPDGSGLASGSCFF